MIQVISSLVVQKNKENKEVMKDLIKNYNMLIGSWSMNDIQIGKK